MPFTIDDLKEIDANEMGEKPVLPKGHYEVELGALVRKAGVDKKGEDYLQFSSALTIVRAIDVSQDDLEVAAAEWRGGDVEAMFAETQLWFRAWVFKKQDFKTMHNLLKRATGAEYLPGGEDVLGAIKGLTAIAEVDVEVWDGTPRNKDVKRLLPIEG